MMASLQLPSFFNTPIFNFGQEVLGKLFGEWGILNGRGEPFTGYGLSLISALQSFNRMDYIKENNVPTFPVERGSFAAYNKVQLPATPVITLNLWGTRWDGQQFLNAIDDAANSTNLYTIITPEITYINYTIEKYNYTRSAPRGATLLSVTLYLKEVRQTTEQAANAQNGQITSPKNPADTSFKSSGKVQGKTPTSATQRRVLAGLAG